MRSLRRGPPDAGAREGRDTVPGRESTERCAPPGQQLPVTVFALLTKPLWLTPAAGPGVCLPSRGESPPRQGLPSRGESPPPCPIGAGGHARCSRYVDRAWRGHTAPPAGLGHHCAVPLARVVARRDDPPCPAHRNGAVRRYARTGLSLVWRGVVVDAPGCNAKPHRWAHSLERWSPSLFIRH